MSALQYPEAFNAPNLQVWNNAAFDDCGESEPLTWMSSNHDCVNLTLSLESDDCSKENVRPNEPVGNSREGLLNLNLNLPFNPTDSSLASPVMKGVKWKDPKEGKVDCGRDIDAEIQEIEKEILKLSSRLDVLRLEKAEQNLKTIEPPHGRIVGITRSKDDKDKMKPKINQRGVSLGPAEIASAVRSRPSNKLEVTPVMSVQSRRKSCFWKLEEIDELKVTKDRRKSISLTVSPKTQKTVSKIQPLKQAATTIGSKRAVRKEEEMISSVIQPKRLFKEGEKSTKKPIKPGRVIASRYNQMTISAARKRSFPEEDKEENNRFDKKRASQENANATEANAKKRWEIPKEVIMYRSEEAEPEDKKASNKDKDPSSKTPLSMVRIKGQLPKIKTGRDFFVKESPRDSGPAKRAAELISMRNYFGEEEESTGNASLIRQALSFIDDEEE